MQPRGYSDFFKSGFCAIINRPCGRASSSQNSDVVLPKTTSSGVIEHRPRPVSMVVQTTPRDKARRRRSSLLSLSSFNEKRMMPRTPSFRAVESGESLDWVTAGGPYTPTALNGSSNEVVYRSIDPFCSSPDAKSTYLDSPQDDPFVGTPKRDSLLSFTPSPNRSCIIMSRRERTSPIQTIAPLPCPSRQSSFQYHHYPLVQERSDFFRVVEEEMDFLPLSEVIEVDEVDDEDWDAPARIDWRQFHVDVLTDDDM